MSWWEYLKLKAKEKPIKSICMIDIDRREINCSPTASDLEVLHYLLDVQIFIRQRNSELRDQLVEYQQHLKTYQEEAQKLLIKYHLTDPEVFATTEEVEPDLADLWKQIKIAEGIIAATKGTLKMNKLTDSLIKDEVRRRTK